VLLPNEFGFQSPFSAICKRGRSNEPYLKAFRDLLKKTRWRGRSGIIEAGASLRRGGDFRVLPPRLWLNIEHA
jgi:hypothetical protein